VAGRLLSRCRVSAESDQGLQLLLSGLQVEPEELLDAMNVLEDQIVSRAAIGALNRSPRTNSTAWEL
jgi:hypothetical protein